MLIPAKLWQGAREDATLRRFAMLAVGLLVGAAAYGIQTGLLVNLPYEMNHHLPPPFNGKRVCAELLRRVRQTVVCLSNVFRIPVFHHEMVATGEPAAAFAIKPLVGRGHRVLCGRGQYVMALAATVGPHARRDDLDQRADGEHLDSDSRPRTGSGNGCGHN